MTKDSKKSYGEKILALAFSIALLVSPSIAKSPGNFHPGSPPRAHHAPAHQVPSYLPNYHPTHFHPVNNINISVSRANSHLHHPYFFPPGFFMDISSGSNETHYSPYALSYQSRGLVSGSTTYSPYALSYSNSGLIDLSGGSSGIGWPTTSNSEQTNIQDSSAAYERELKARELQTKRAIARMQEARKNDKSVPIFDALREKRINFLTDRIFRLGDNALSINFLLSDKRLILNYTDPNGISALQGSTKILYECHKTNSAASLKDYSAKGWKVVEITDAKNLEAILN